MGIANTVEANCRLIHYKEGNGYIYMSESKEKLYCYAKPNHTIPHRYIIDVETCWAKDIDEAMKKFSELYGDIQKEDVTLVKSKKGEAIFK